MQAERQRRAKVAAEEEAEAERWHERHWVGSHKEVLSREEKARLPNLTHSAKQALAAGSVARWWPIAHSY